MVETNPAFKPLLSGQRFGVWRVKQIELLEVPQKDWGRFYAGDCYLVFSGGEGEAGEHVFYWYGREASQDEKTTAAVMARELDNLFGGLKGCWYGSAHGAAGL